MPRFYETTLSITNLHNLSISTHVNRSRISYDDTYYSAIFSKIYIQSSLPPTITIKSFGLKETTISDKRFIKREIVERQPGWSRKRQYDIYNAYRYRGSYPNHLIVPTGCTANYSDWEVDLIEEVDF